jgi:ribonuclease HI
METLVIHTDGASRGNPGKAGIGVVIYNKDKSETIKQVYKYLGTATNNVAEYTALLTGLKEASKLGANQIELYLDSELIVKQIKGEYRVKNEGLKPLYNEVTSLLKQFQYNISHVPRENNKKADELANKAIDEKDATV